MRYWPNTRSYPRNLFSHDILCVSGCRNVGNRTIHDLFVLLQDPYDEGTPEQQERFYRRAPDAALKAGGTAFMS